MATAPALLEGYMTLAGIFDKTNLSETERLVLEVFSELGEFLKHELVALAHDPHAQGYIAGRILGEVLLAVISGGIGNVSKAALKSHRWSRTAGHYQGQLADCSQLAHLKKTSLPRQASG